MNPANRRPRLRWMIVGVAVIPAVWLGFREPIRREFQYRLAVRSLAADQLDDAEARLDALISETPRETRARLALVAVYRRQGRITEAEETLQRAVELGLPLDDARPEHARLQAQAEVPAMLVR